MPRIVIRFIRTPGFVTSSICWVTSSLFDHVEFGVEENGAIIGWLGAHASGGVQLRPANYCQPSFERRYGLPVSELQYMAWQHYASKEVGTRYNFLDIAGLLFKSRTLNSPNRLICSQFAFLGLLMAGFQPLNVLSGYAHLITPEMLHLSPILIGREIK